MRRRLTVAMVTMVVAALVVTGVTGVLFAVHGARRTTQQELLAQAQGLAASVTDEAAVALANRRNPAQTLHTILAALRSPLRLDGVAVAAVSPTGSIYDPTTLRPRAATLPAGVTAPELDPAELLLGRDVVGRRGGLVFAAVPYRATVEVDGIRRAELQVVVLSRRPPTGLGAAGLPVLLTAAAVVALAVLVADRLGRRIVAPLLATEAVTARIAGGDLAARVPETDGDGYGSELASLSRSVNTMAEALASARGAERQFLLSISHELRTPLTSIRGFAEAIEDGAVDDTARAATVIATEARRLERLVRDLLVLAGIEARRFALDMTTLDLAAVVAAGAAGFRPAADEAGVTVDAATGPTPVLALGDPDRVAQVVANLVENALRYTRRRVLVGAAPSDGYPVLWVEDDGPGIAPEDLAEVFDRSHSAGQRGGRPGGTGLGLAIVAELVRAMGGTVRAESPVVPDGGTRMVVTLRPPARPD